ncbi:MAG: Na+-transporting NADH:ubiquinone oxidoreductase subunit C [Litorivivens sp.]|jgi:Na+-transporting NADH:ubiquinone oxidoreductase subunit C
MAIDKNSNVFTFAFATIMVVVVGTILAFLFISLKPMQVANEEDKKKMDIMGAIGFESGSEPGQANRLNSGELFDQYVIERISLNSQGEVIKTSSGPIITGDKTDPFNIDVKKEYKSKIKKVAKKFKKDPEGLETAMQDLEVSFPLYKCEREGNELYVIPVSGTGLWGPIWGYVALEKDFTTIYGAKFDHDGETPGLGAEIKEDFFQVRFTGKTMNYGNKNVFEVVKGGTPNMKDYQVDGITGGTITSKGVGEMVNRTLKIYENYFKTL